MGSTVLIRARRSGDLPRLVEVLGAQQPLSRYPLRWPLPLPVEEFVVRPGELAAWVAEEEDTVVGHVALLGIEPGWEADAFRASTGLPVERLASVSVLFVDSGSTGRGVGGALLAAAVDRARELGRVPVLDVVAQHSRAVELYRRHGWTVVGETRPSWLPAGEGPFLVMVLDEPVPGAVPGG